MRAGIYQITHIESGNCYIGSSCNIRRRFKDHKAGLRRGSHHSPYLQNAWNKYGEQAFEFKQLIACSPEMCLFYEQLFLDAYLPPYNTAKIAGSCSGIKRSDEVKDKLKKLARQRRAKYEWKGTKMSLIDIAEVEGVNHSLLISRVVGAGYSVGEALEKEQRIFRHDLEYGGRTQTIIQWSKELGIHPRRLQYRIAEGYTIAEVITRLEKEATSKTMSFSEHCRLAGVPLTTAKSRVKAGMSLMDAVTVPTKNTNRCKVVSEGGQ